MSCTRCGGAESLLAPAKWAGLCQTACEHLVCAPCLRSWVEEQRPQDSEEEEWHCRVPCLEVGCGEVLPPALVHHVAPGARRAPARAAFALELRRTHLSMTFGILAVGENCPGCGPREGGGCEMLLRNDCCGHTFCEGCWRSWVEEQTPEWRRRCQVAPVCREPGCSQRIKPALWQHLCQLSDSADDFQHALASEVERLKRSADGVLLWASPATSAGPECPQCGTIQLALLKNQGCAHAACEACWTRSAEGQLQQCEAERRLRPRCLAEGCRSPACDGVWRHVGTRSEAALAFAERIRAEVERLSRKAGSVLTWASSPCEVGPLCQICDKLHLALLENPGCGHRACEDCWASWSDVHVDRCRVQKQVAVRCCGEGCQQVVAYALWDHASTRSEGVAALEMQLARRRRLQNNALFPALMQVDCPQEGCLGLGYLGYDTVMCFFCEHQWQAEDGSQPTGLGEELLAGEVMKQCPGCGEHIIKNGGCDHMTCRCRHEFWWTTLLPYRR